MSTIDQTRVSSGLTREHHLKQEQRTHLEQATFRCLVGTVHLKRWEGIWYQRRPSGWHVVHSLSDLIIEEETSS